MPKTKKGKKRKRATRIRYECTDFSCEYNGVVVDDGAPAPENCFCTKPLVTKGYIVEDEDEDDGAFPSPTAPNSPRPGWKKGRRVEIKDRATSPGGMLYCQICKKEIVVNEDGKEEWTSKSGKLHETSPHIDHYGRTEIPLEVTGGVPGVAGDWIERKRALRADDDHRSKSTPERLEIEKDVFNASPIRTTHMKCNCSRPKH